MTKKKKGRFHASDLLVWPGMWLLALGELGSRLSPEWFAWLAPFGLTHALGWLLVAFGWVWRIAAFRWLKVVVPAAVLAVTWPSFNRVFSVGDSYFVTEEQPGWGVLTFNVRRLDEFEWLEGDQTRKDLATWLSKRQEEIWCFQEFPADGKRMLSQADFSWRASGKKLLTWPQGAGPAVATSFKVLGSESWMFDEETSKGRVMQVDLESPDGPIRLFNVHLQSLYFSKEDYQAVEQGPTKEEGKRLWGMLMGAYQGRALQAQGLRKRIEDSPYPVVLAGDFNDNPVSYTMRQLEKGRVRDAFRSAPIGLGATHIGTVPGLRIDGLLIDTLFSCSGFRTHDVVLSDHRPVSVQVVK